MPLFMPEFLQDMSARQSDIQPLLYLASASPRRRELLTQLGLAYQVLPQDIDESRRPEESAAAYVGRMAREKAAAALQDAGYVQALPVLAADTSVVCDGMILGKPDNLEALVTMLGLLSGRRHEVMTAVSVQKTGHEATQVVSSRVSFRNITHDEMLAYWHTGEPRDKAGGYAIQGLGAMFVSALEGSYSAVVGLPLFETMQLLGEFGIEARAVLEAYT